MANNLSGDPILIDTFGADREISVGPIKIEGPIVVSVTTAKTCVFADANDNVALRVKVPANDTRIVPGPMNFKNGLKFDESASTMANANDVINIFVQP